MRDFMLNELYGPIPCEHKTETVRDCKEDTLIVRLTDEENAKLPEPSGPVATKYILKERLGTALCEKHR